MAIQNELSGRVGLDITDFKSSVSELSRQVRVIQSGFQASAAALGNWSKTAAGNKERIDALNRVIPLQKQKIENLTKNYNELKESGKASTTQLQKLAITINKENEALNRNQAELRQCETRLKDLENDLHKQPGLWNRLSAAAKKSGNDASGAVSRVKSHFGGLRSAIGGALAMLSGFSLGAMINEAAKAQSNLAQLDAVLKSTGGAAGVTKDQAIKLADSLSQVTKFEDDTILSAENLLLTFTKISGDIMPRATEAVLNMSTALGQDTKTSAIQLGKALNDPIAGTTALRRVGVQLTNQQEAQIKKMVEAGDTAGAQAVILKELETEFGNSARAAGETFGGQLEIAKNAIKNAGESVGTALIPTIKDFIPIIKDAAQKFGEFVTAHSGDIKAFISNIFDIGKTIFNVVAPPIKWLLDFVIKNGPAAKSIVLAIGAAIASIKIGKNVINGINSIKDTFDKVKTSISNFSGALTTSNTTVANASGAAGAFSKVLGVTGVVGAIAGVILAIGSLVGWVSKSRQEVIDLCDEITKTDEAFKKVKGELDSNAVIANKLVGQLENLASKTNKTAEEKAKLKRIVGELNKLEPELALAYDETTDKLNMKVDALKEVIKQRQNEARLTAYEQRMVELEKEHLELTEKRKEALKVIAQYGSLIAATSSKEGQLAQDAKINLEALDVALKGNEERTSELANEYTNLATTTSTAATTMQENIEKTTTTTAENLAEQKEALEQHYADVTELARQYNDDMGGIWDEHIKTQKTSLNKVISNLKNQVTEFQNWRTNLKKVAKRVPPDIAEELEKLGPEAAPLIAELVTTSDKKLNEFVGLMRKKGALGVQAAAEGIESKEADMVLKTKIMGQRTAKALGDGMTSQNGQVENSAKQTANALTGPFSGISAMFFGFGASAGSNTSGGIMSKWGSVSTAARGAKSQMTTPFNNIWETFRGIGTSAGQGLISAISPSNAGFWKDLWDKSYDMGKRVEHGARAGLNSRSPSKKMYDVGRDAVAGLVNSIRDGLNRVRAAGAAMGAAAIPNLSAIKAAPYSFGSGASGGQSVSSTTTIDQSRKPVVNVYGDVHLENKNSAQKTLQQLQFMTAL